MRPHALRAAARPVPTPLRAPSRGTTLPAMNPSSLAPDDPRLRHARVLVELGELADAERQTTAVLDEHPDHLTALSLLAKIAHIRGELSRAVACWAQLHARSAHHEWALTYIRSVMQSAPAQNIGDFLPLGPSQLARKPAAHRELEHVFRLFFGGRPDEARAHCDQLAEKYKVQDRDSFKLFVLAKAWISELSGELDASRITLEALGRERGFETDTDRILALARVCLRMGSREHLEKAVRIFEHLDRRFAKLSARGQLAVLYRQLGLHDEAEYYEQLHLRAFQERMHRPSLQDIARTAAERYIPLERLRTIRPAHTLLDRALTHRELGIVASLQHDLSNAQRWFQHGSDLLDKKYLANLVALHGDPAEAAQRFLYILSSNPDDRYITSWLLSYYLQSRSETVAEHFRRPVIRDRTLYDLDARLRTPPVRASTWREMAALQYILGNVTEADRCLARATALEEASLRDALPIGRILAAAVYHFVGKAKGLVHQIWVDRTPVAPGRGGSLPPENILGNVTAEMRHAIRNTFFAVREYARSRFPLSTKDIFDYDYTYKVTKEDEPSGGLSAGLPTALAFLSVFLQRPIPQDMAFSGVVVADAHDVLTVRHVGEAEYKVKAAYHRNLRVLVLPKDNRDELMTSAQVPRAISEEIVRFVSNLDEAATLTFGDTLWT